MQTVAFFCEIFYNEIMEERTFALLIYGAYLILIGLVTTFSYGADKKRAINGQRRIPEKTLLMLSLFGGAPFGLLAMVLFRHKTKKEHWYFTAINLFGIILHATIFVVLAVVIKF